MRVYRGIKELVTMSSAAKKDGRRVVESDLSIIRSAAIIENRGVIIWLGPEKKLQLALKVILQARKAKNIKGEIQVIDLKALCVVPAFIECHTHLIFSGDRKHEFELRNRGLTYKQIAQQGGGIKLTVAHTRQCGEVRLLQLAQARANRFLEQGVTTLEVKSGYGLSERQEVKILKVAKKINKMRVVRTYLGLHAIPRGRKAPEYLQEVIKKTLPKIKRLKLAERVDVFIEKGYFSLEQAKKFLMAASNLGFRLSAHVEQMSRSGAGAYLSDYVDSIDHVIQVTTQDILKISHSPTTVVLLPASDMYLKMKYPPARALLDRGARVALATDFNPGTSPTQDLSLVGVLARLEMKMTLAEVLSAYTVGAAHALNLQKELGSLEVGKKCDFVVLDGSWRDLFYQVGHHPVLQVYKEGARCFLIKS